MFWKSLLSLLLAALTLGCDIVTCREHGGHANLEFRGAATEQDLPASCEPQEQYTIQIALHYNPPTEPCFGVCPTDHGKVRHFLTVAEGYLADAGISLEIEEIPDSYNPIFIDEEKCDDVDEFEELFERTREGWGRDGRLHLYVMDFIYRSKEDQYFQGYYHQEPSGYCTGVLLVLPNANEKILAHELGHALGLRHSEGDATNMMTPGELHKAQGYDEDQIERLRARAAERSCYCGGPTG